MRRRKVVGALAMLVLSGLVAGSPVAAQTNPDRPADGPASAELRKIRDADQADRTDNAAFTDPNRAPGIVRRDRERRDRVLALLQADKLRTAEDYDNAALVFQHGETPDDILVSHELSLIAGLKGRFSNGPTNAEDRFLQKVGRKQRFGSQFDLAGNLVTDTVQTTSDTAVTDELHADLFVPPLAAAREGGIAAIQKSFEAIIERQKQRSDPAWVAEQARRPESRELSRLAQSGTGTVGAARRRVLELYHAGALATPDDYFHAAQVLARGTGDDVLLAHEMALVAALRRQPKAPKLAAQTWDRYLVSVGQPQRYGTIANAPVAPSVTDSVRAALGVPPRQGVPPRRRQAKENQR